jgi:hypothetical protein
LVDEGSKGRRLGRKDARADEQILAMILGSAVH